MVGYRIVAESTVHSGRRLLVDFNGDGYLQLAPGAGLLPVSAKDFERLCKMQHYRPVTAQTPPPIPHDEPLELINA